jgi:hypothetical protein
MRFAPCLVLCSLLAVSCDSPDPPPARAPAPSGRLERINGCLVLHVAGTPEQMGEQHGRLLRQEIRRACRALIRDSYAGASYDRLIEGVKVMERHQPEAFRREMKALARAAGIDYWDCVAMQLFGDVDRGQPFVWPDEDPWGVEPDEAPDDLGTPADTGAPRCTSYAVFGPATKTGELIAGRNLDFYDCGVGEYGAVLMHARPDRAHAFVTVTWAGIINGWTLMNDRGLVTANNSAFGGTDSLEGISTCFLLRHVVQHAATVEEGIALVRQGPRACGTNMLIAGGHPPDAVIVEFDHKAVAVRRAENGAVYAANSFQKLGMAGRVSNAFAAYGRYGRLGKLISEHHGKIDRTMNFAGAEGVPMFCNLHSALLFPKALTFRVSMGKAPAYEHPYRAFRMTPGGVVSAED